MSNPFEDIPTDRKIDELVDEIRQLLQGKGPMLQGAALADVVSMYFAGHNPAIREVSIEAWIRAMRGLIEVNEEMVLKHYGMSGWDTN